MRKRRLIPVGFVCALAMTVLAASTSSASTPPGSAAPASGAQPVGDASAILPAVDLQTAGTDFAPLAEASPQPVVVGDALRTDSTGYAEVAYLDGSRTRLDVNTEFTVLALVDAAGNADTRTQMGLGRTWNRVESVGQGGGFSVATSVATATVTGTAFSIQCVAADSCRFVVVEGTVRLELLDGTMIDVAAPSSVDVTAAVVTGPTPLPWDAVFSDQWLVDNTNRDVFAGFPDRATVYQTYGPAFGSLAGTYAGTRTVTEASCVAACLDTSAPVGDVADRSYTFDIDCSAGVPCTGTVDTQYTMDGVMRNENTPLTFDGASFTWTIEPTSPCGFDNDGDGVVEDVTGETDSVLTWAMTPTAGRVDAATWAIASLEGTATQAVTTTGECPLGFQGEAGVASVSVSR